MDVRARRRNCGRHEHQPKPGHSSTQRRRLFPACLTRRCVRFIGASNKYFSEAVLNACCKTQRQTRNEVPQVAALEHAIQTSSNHMDSSFQLSRNTTSAILI